MNETDAHVLIPSEMTSVDFYGEPIVVAVIEDENQAQPYVSLRMISSYLGLSWSGQLERTKRDPVLADALRYMRIDQKNGGGDQEMIVLPLEYLPGWLFGISVNRVHPRLHESLYRYRKECFRVLAAHFPQTFARELFDAHEPALPGGVPGTVYVASGGGYHKIGISRSAEKRIKSLNGALPFPVVLVHTIQTDDALLLERRLHRLYRAAGKHVNGEWFSLTEADVEALRRIESPFLTTFVDQYLSALVSVSDGEEVIYE